MNNLEQFNSFGKRNKERIISNNKSVIYTRVSDIKQQDNTSLSSQKKYCTEYAEKRGFEVCKYFGGKVASAKTDDRKEFKEMLAFVRRRKISNIIVYSIDRFSRSGASAISTVEELNRKGINVLSVTQPVNNGTSTGSFFQNINLLFSKYDNDQRREKTIGGMRERLRDGFWMGTAPMGYKNARNEKNIPIILPDEKAKLIRKAFLWKANEGLANAEIVKKLEAHGLKIYRQQLTRMFKNPVYCGLLSHSLLEGEVIQGIHPAIVSKDIFLKVNGIQAKNHHGYTHKKINDNLPLKGFAKCSGCGSNMSGYLVKKKGLYYYKCKTTGCSSNRSAKFLHGLFEKLIEVYQVKEELSPIVEIQVKNTFDLFNKTKEESKETLKYNLKTINEKIEKLEERFAIGEIKHEMYEKFVKKFWEERADVEKEMKKNGFDGANQEKYLDKAIKFFTNLKEMWELGGYEAKQRFQFMLFPDGIVYDRKKDMVRTTQANPVLEIIHCISTLLENKKSGQKLNLSTLSARVIPAGFEPATVCLEGIGFL